MLRRLQMTEARPLPNWWLSTGLLETAGGDWSEGVLFLGLLIANALFFRELAGIAAERIYRRAYWAAAGMGSRPARVQMGWFDSTLNFCLRFLPPQMRLILMKDVRLFRRDPLQWSQFLILVGLLLLYFINVHRVSSSQKFSQWVNVVSFMNLSVVGLLMSTFTTRFVFPMVSLEGRCFWLLGLLPLKRDTILWSKFLFSVGSLLVPCGLLVMLSDWRLDVPKELIVEHQLTSLLLCLGLSGIGVGLGAQAAAAQRAFPFADRRRLRRHAEPGHQHALYRGRARAQGHALPHLACRQDRPGHCGRQRLAGDSSLGRFVAGGLYFYQRRDQSRGRAAADVDRHPHLPPAGVSLTPVVFGSGAGGENTVGASRAFSCDPSFLSSIFPSSCLPYSCLQLSVLLAWRLGARRCGVAAVGAYIGVLDQHFS